MPGPLVLIFGVQCATLHHGFENGFNRKKKNIQDWAFKTQMFCAYQLQGLDQENPHKKKEHFFGRISSLNFLRYFTNRFKKKKKFITTLLYLRV